MADSLQTVSALNGQVLNTYSITSHADIKQQITAARLAAKTWAAAPVAERVEILAKLNALILADIDAITEFIVTVTGKVKTEVVLGEIYPVLELLRYYEKNAVRILKPCHLSTAPLAFPSASAQFERHPYGVVAVISPWNFPFQLTLSPLITALISGNAVIFKTSELSIAIGELISQLLNRIDLPAGLVQHIIGEAQAAEQLIDSRPDLIYFTGGIKAGRAIMARAAQHPIPVILELGGKDAMLVFDDANLNTSISFATNSKTDVRVDQLPVRWETQSPLYLPTRELLTIYPRFVSVYDSHHLEFEETWRDTCDLLSGLTLKGKRADATAALLEPLETALGGKVVLDNNGRFYLNIPGSGNMEMPLVAEGHRKLAMLARLILNGVVQAQSYLFWDEPEANLNPRLIRLAAQVIQALCLRGVQVFIATHSFFLLKELDLLSRQQAISQRFIGLNRRTGDLSVSSQQVDSLAGLSHLVALDEELAQYDRELSAGNPGASA